MKQLLYLMHQTSTSVRNHSPHKANTHLEGLGNGYTGALGTQVPPFFPAIGAPRATPGECFFGGLFEQRTLPACLFERPRNSGGGFAPTFVLNARTLKGSSLQRFRRRGVFGISHLASNATASLHNASGLLANITCNFDWQRPPESDIE